MKHMVKYPSIEQFRNVIQKVQHSAQYAGYDPVTETTIMNRGAKMPVITVTATEKIHGTNGGVSYSHPDGFWVQSRENIITAESDNAACAFHAMQNKDVWVEIINALAEEYHVDLNKQIITLYFEWAGSGIQKNSAVTGLDKMAILFKHFKVSPLEPSETEPAVWFDTKIGDTWIDKVQNRIFNICNFPTYEFDIDFNTPVLSQNKMVELVEKIIEPNSPVGLHFGIEKNIGEGIVCSFKYKNALYQFKVKGTAHSSTKVKTLKPVDDVKIQKIQVISQQLTPAWRLEQMFALANDTINGGIPKIENMGTFLKFVNQDILKEESDVITTAGLEPKEMFPTISRIARQWYTEELDRMVFNT